MRKIHTPPPRPVWNHRDGEKHADYVLRVDEWAADIHWVSELRGNVAMSPERPHKARLPRKLKKKLRKKYRYFIYDRYYNEYACPKCGWEPACFDGVYYRVDAKRRRAVTDVYPVDWEKQPFGHDNPVFNKPLTDAHWPKFSDEGYGAEGATTWHEDYQCCKCFTVFGWDNSSH